MVTLRDVELNSTQELLLYGPVPWQIAVKHTSTVLTGSVEKWVATLIPDQNAQQTFRMRVELHVNTSC